MEPNFSSIIGYFWGQIKTNNLIFDTLYETQPIFAKNRSTTIVVVQLLHKIKKKFA
jgi:hypothetical protein